MGLDIQEGSGHIIEFVGLQDIQRRDARGRKVDAP